jgi:hypothetical protein
MSEWRTDRNRQALARLTKALLEVFPAPVLTHALERALVPPLPRLAVDSYWRAHPLRADRLARACGKKRRTGRMDMATRREPSRAPARPAPARSTRSRLAGGKLSPAAGAVS